MMANKTLKEDVARTKGDKDQLVALARSWFVPFLSQVCITLHDNLPGDACRRFTWVRRGAVEGMVEHRRQIPGYGMCHNAPVCLLLLLPV